MLAIAHVFQKKGFAVFLRAALDPLGALGRLPGALSRALSAQLCHLPLLALGAACPQRSVAVTLFTDQTPACDGSWGLSPELLWE